MTFDPRLTVLLTLKGRDLYTLRWLWHANRIKLPFAVCVADGEVNPAVAGLVEDPAVFPNLRIEYRRYNDLTFHDFHLKVSDAVASIKTPYVMMSDNDDFLLSGGVIASLDWLDRAPGYVSAGGAVGHFESDIGNGRMPHLCGRIRRFWYQQATAYRAYDLQEDRAAPRAEQAYRGFLTTCYNVFRVETLRKVTAEIAAIDFTRLDNAELYLILRTATLGKVKSFASFMSYLRQLGTSSNPSRGKDFVVSLSTEKYIGEIQEIVARISEIAAANDGIAPQQVASTLNEIAAARLRQKLVAVLGWRAAVKNVLRDYLSDAVLTGARALGKHFRSGVSSAAGGRPINRGDIFKLADAAGASAVQRANMERDLAAIEATMADDDFMAFVRVSAPSLLNPAAEGARP